MTSIASQGGGNVAATAPAVRPWLWATLAYVATTLVFFLPLLPSLASALPADLGDPALNAWILWWNTQAVPFTAEWWNAPIFHPLPDMLALSETLIGLTPVTTPLQWLGASPVVAYNAVLVLSYPAAAIAAHALAFRLTGRHDAAFIAGMAFGFSPYRAGQLSHVQMMITFWLPLGLLALHWFVDTGRRRWAALAAVCWMGAALATGYFLIYFAVLIGCWMGWFARTRRHWIGAMTAFLLAALLLAPLLWAYRQKQEALDLSRGMGEIVTFSADLTAIWAAAPRTLAYAWTFEPKPEGELYPGAVILLVAVVGIAAVWHRSRGDGAGARRRLRTALFGGALAAAAAGAVSWWLDGWQFGPISMNRPHRPINVAVWLAVAAVLVDPRIVNGFRRRSRLLFYTLAACAMFLLAMGPFPTVFGERFMYQAPYAWLMQLPGGDALRVPARFGVLFVLCLGQAAAMAFARLAPTGRAAWLAPALAALIAIDGSMPGLEVLKVVPPLERAGLPDQALVLELPLRHHQSDTKAMLRATDHRLPLINGYSGYHPPHYSILADGLTDQLDPEIVRTLQRLGPIVVLVSRNEGVFEQYRDLMDAYPDATRVGNTPAGVVYRLPALPAPARDLAAVPLAIASLEATSRPANVDLMTDGDTLTRWETLGRQSAGDTVVARLGAPATIARVEMDLGRWHGDYPRGLRIEVAADRESPGVVVLDEPTGGETMLGLMADPSRATLAFDLPPGVTGQVVRLILTAGHHEMSWSIAELRVFGR